MKTPAGKKALNLHVTDAEHVLLKEWASLRGGSVTAVVRDLIRDRAYATWDQRRGTGCDCRLCVAIARVLGAHIPGKSKTGAGGR